MGTNMRPVTLWRDGDLWYASVSGTARLTEHRALLAAEYDALVAENKRVLDAVERAAACIDRVLSIVGDSHGKPLAQIIGGISAAAHDARALLSRGGR